MVYKYIFAKGIIPYIHVYHIDFIFVCTIVVHYAYIFFYMSVS